MVSCKDVELKHHFILRQLQEKYFAKRRIFTLGKAFDRAAKVDVWLVLRKLSLEEGLDNPLSDSVALI